MSSMMRLLSLLGFAGAALAACNGHDELCDRQYSNITFVGSHDSAFVGELPVDNQYLSITDQLDLGVRFLQAQTHSDDGGIELCHTYCWEKDAGPLSDYLQSISDWMGSNSDEVVTLLLTNGDAIAVTDFDSVFEDTGLKDYVYTPDGVISKDEWPTLQELINNGTRLIVLMDYNSNQDDVPYILDEFSFFWETTYGVTDSSFPDCDVDRPSGGDPTKLMGIMNHMLNYEVVDVTFPDMDAASNTNSESSIGAEIDLCISQHSVQPNVVLLDWINIGQAIDEGNSLNGL